MPALSYKKVARYQIEYLLAWLPYLTLSVHHNFYEYVKICGAKELYQPFCKIIGQKHDISSLDVFHAVIE